MIKLVIVESPNKVKSIQKYLDESAPGPWRVIATVGHWRGLPAMRGQAPGEVFDIANGSFTEAFEVQNKEVESRLASAIRAAQVVYLASDPDREGEAIAWHVASHFKLAAPRRLEFHAITHDGIARGLAAERELDRNLAEAQRARAALDYLVGMEVSRRLWRFGAKSAGRVQSCALRILAARERAIEAFVPTDYFAVWVEYREGFRAILGELQTGVDENGDELPERVEPKRVLSNELPFDLLAQLKNSTHTVRRIESTVETKKAPPPYTTAALLGEASALGASPEKVTAAAQTLFEKGLVTYIRTDSVALAPEAVQMVRTYLRNHHPNLLPKEEVKRGDGAHAQGAHEAIRPTSMEMKTPPEIFGLELKLYEHIWLRTLASQAVPAVSDKTIVTITTTSGHTLMARGTVVRELGFKTLLRDADESKEGDNASLPPLRETQIVHTDKAHGTPNTTKPPPRFTIKTLIRYLERRGIGRPSTYNTLISTLFARGYISQRKSQLVPEELGLVCDELMHAGFDQIAQEQFTAITERSLDKIASGGLRRDLFLRGFWQGLEQLLASSTTAFDRYGDAHPDLDRTREVPHNQPCPVCGKQMLRRNGKNGAYAKCTACPKTLDLSPPTVAKEPCPVCGFDVHEKRYRKEGKAKRLFVCTSCPWRSSEAPPKIAAKSCPTCNGVLWSRGPKNDRFWGCARYPECRGHLPWDATKARRTKRKTAR